MIPYKPKALPPERPTDMRMLFFGGCGGHISEDLAKGLQGIIYPRANVSSWAFNTDREDLVVLPDSVYKVLIGDGVTGRGGAGSDPANGLLAAQENEEDLNAIISGGKIVIFVAGLGGGTGSGTIPYAVDLFKQQIKDQDSLPIRDKRAGIVFVITPYTSEDAVKHKYAKDAWEKLYDLKCPVIVIPNDRFLSPTDHNRTIRQMHAEGNKRIAQILGRLIRSLGMRHNIYNIDQNDIITNLLLGENDTPQAYCGVGYGTGTDAVKMALEDAANNPLLKVELQTCRKAIIAIDCKDAKESDKVAIHDFTAKYRLQPDADWRVGLHDEYEPLEFEKEAGATAVAMIFGVSGIPLKEQQEVAQNYLNYAPPSQLTGAQAVVRNAVLTNGNSERKMPTPIREDIEVILQRAEPKLTPQTN